MEKLSNHVENDDPARGIHEKRYDQIMRTSKFAPPCVLVMMIAGCGNYTTGGLKLTSRDLVGTYKDNNPLGTSILVLKPDNTFSQTLVTKSARVYTAVGRWTYDSSDSQIDIDNGLSYDDLRTPDKPKVERAGMSYSVEKVIPDGQPQIIVDPDQSIALSKIK